MRYFLAIGFLFYFLLGQAQKDGSLKVDLQYYLPDIDYNEKITTPEAFFGFQIGEWHVSHDRLVAYMEKLTRESSRFTLETYAKSHERRPLIMMTISSEKNLQNIDNIRQQHIDLTDASKSRELSTEEMPIVIYQGYSVHGNESSGANAAILIAYYLAAGEGKVIDELLDNSVVLLDPCYNPDGFQRFASWVNRHKSATLNPDPNDREFKEVWPGGRTNHYWFDLNRDWLLLTHPESRGRIANFQKWKPNVLTDHHEMGTNSTFFFQPGVPERTNPNTPQLNQDLTEQIGTYHARALDKIGSMYYTKESFDDFYYGKGSTYPDIQGSIGILFEQASSRGHVQESVNGDLTFPFTIRNQVVTSLSTQEASIAMRKEILDYQRNFFLDASKEAKKSTIKAYQIPKNPDYNKAVYLVDILLQHDIQVMDDDAAEGYFYIPVDQKQSRLIHTIFEEVTDFKVNIFYDVSTWTFSSAFDLDVQAISNFSAAGKTLLQNSPRKKIQFPTGQSNFVSYAFEWTDWKASTLLTRLLKEDIQAITMHEIFDAETINGMKSFGRGSIIVPAKNSTVRTILEREATELGIEIFGITTGLSTKGVMLGSPSTYRNKEVKALMVVGNGVNGYDAGEIWHHMDTRLEIPLTKVEITRLGQINLDRYNTLIFPDGRYSSLTGRSIKKIDAWVRAGGNIIAFKRAISQMQKMNLIQYKEVPKVSTDYENEEYGDSQEKSAKHVIGGAIFDTEIDITYPLFYGYTDNKLATFKRGTLAIKANTSSLANPMIYSNDPVSSGYSSDENKDRIANTAGILVYKVGAGKVVCSVDNPLFRGYWIGGNKLFDNMLYLTGSISGRGTK